jgi:hypothetical protein
LVAGSSEDFTNGNWVKDNVTASADTLTTSATTAEHRVYQNPANTLASSIAVDAKAGTANFIGVSKGTLGLYATFNLSTGAVVASVGGTAAITLTSDGWYRCSITGPINSSFHMVHVGESSANAVPGTVYLGTGKTVQVRKAQLEDITGRTDQTTPSSYVSVGVLSAPYHGAGVDGVEYFNTDLTGAALPTAYTYDSVSLNGVAGTYVSTPDSVAASITGDIDIRVKAALADWTPANYTGLVGKLITAGQYSYILYVDTGSTGKLLLQRSNDGTAVIQALSTVATGITDGATYWVRVTYASATGAVTFYTSSDGATWTQLGAVVSTAVGTIFNGTDIVTIGAQSAGSISVTGKIYQAQIYNGIDGTLAVDFDASRYAGGTTLPGSTGETWTLQGNAKIHPTNSPNLGYLAEAAGTNLCRQSQDYTTTWALTAGVAVVANQYTAPDGTLTMDQLKTVAGNTQHYLSMDGITYTSAAYTHSEYLKYDNHRYVGLVIYDGTNVNCAVFDLLNGTTGAVSAGVTSRIEATNVAGLYRCSVTATAVAIVGFYAFITLNNTNTATLETWNAAGTEKVGVWGAQVELGSAATSYIPTTTAAVTRNADVLTFPTAGNVSGTTGAIYAEGTWSVTGTNGGFVDTDSTGNRGFMITTPGVLDLYDGTSQNTSPAAPVIRSTPAKVAATWGGSAKNCVYAGTLGTPSAFDGDMNIGANMSVGIRGTTAGAQNLNGTIRNVRIWQRALSSSELQAITR